MISWFRIWRIVGEVSLLHIEKQPVKCEFSRTEIAKTKNTENDERKVLFEKITTNFLSLRQESRTEVEDGSIDCRKLMNNRNYSRWKENSGNNFLSRDIHPPLTNVKIEFNSPKSMWKCEGMKTAEKYEKYNKKNFIHE